MPLYLGTDEAGTTGASLQEFAPTFGQKMSAATREAWLESYGPVATDFVRSRMTEDKRRITAAEAEAIRQDRGGGVRMVLKPKDNEYTAGQWATIVDRQRELAAVKDVRERTPWELGSVARGAAMFGAGIVDPINLATAFVPWTRTIGAMRGTVATAQTGATLGARTGARAAVGAVDGGISTLALEPFYYAGRQALGDDYDAVDSMANIAFGTAFGGGVHVIGGAAGDAWRAWRARPGMITPDPMRDVVSAPQGAIVGNETRVRVGNEYEPARWTLVEADTLQATVDKADNQFRDRSRPAYQAEIQQRANNLDPALVLADSPVMDIGAPTLAADGRIVGGNGRTLFITRAYEIGKAGEYRAELERRLADLGIDPDAVRNMQRPVLVRQFSRAVDVKRAAMLSNEGGATVMSPLEQSKVDSERLGDARLQVAQDGALDGAENRPAIRKWVESMPENQRNAVMDSDGRLSPEGQRRLSNAMLFRAYGDSPVLGRLVEAMDPGSRNLASAIGRTAPVVANMRAEIAAGNLHPLDLAADLQQAVEKFNQLREQGARVADYLAQVDAFGDGLTPEALMLLEFIGRNIQSPRRLMDGITGFVDRLTAAGNPKQTDMFGDAVAPDKGALLQDAIRAAESAPETAAEVAASLAPETREAVLRAAVAQSVDGRAVDVDAIVGMDPGRRTTTIEDVEAAMDRNVSPDEQPLADVESARAVEERNAAAPKWQALEAADQAQAEADAALGDVVKAGEQAFKYSRGEAPGQKKATLWQGTTARFAPEEGAPLGRFRWDMINSEGGEQAQAFGYGHYLAQQAWISQTRYRERLIGRKKSVVTSFAIPDGSGGVLTLNPSKNDPAWVLADGTIVHESQNDLRLAMLAAAIAQVRLEGYAKARQTLEAILRGNKEAVSRRLADIDKVNAGRRAEMVDATPERLAVLQRDINDSANFREKLLAGLENDAALLAALDEVTQPQDVAFDPAALDGSFGSSKFYIERSGSGSEVTLFMRGSPFGFGNRQFDSIEEAVGFVRESARVLAQGIKKYEPPVPENLRERVTAGGEEVDAELADAVYTLLHTDQDGYFTNQLVETVGRGLDVRTAELAGANARLNIGAMIEALEGAGPGVDADGVLARLQALLDRGIEFIEVERPGSLYRAEMDAADFQNLMLWDEPLSAQPQVVLDAFKRWGYVEIEDWETHTANLAVAGMKDFIGDGLLDDDPDLIAAYQEISRRRGESAGTASGYRPQPDELISVMLHNAGVPGHAFLDGVSRGNTDAPAYNIVIYSDDVARIVDRYARQTGEIGRATDTPEGLTEALRLSFGRDTDALLQAGRVQVVATPKDIPGGPHPADVKAATAPDDMVYVVAQNVSELEARGILLHEVGVHVGMERMLGREVFDSVLTELDDAIARGEDWAQAARAAVPADTPAGLVREEQLAYLVQNAPELPIVQRIIAAVRAWAYRTFEFARERLTLSEADFRAMAVSALREAAQGGRMGEMAPAFSRDVAQTGTKAFRDWFGDSKVVDAEGRPLVVYHGTASDFEAFDRADGSSSGSVTSRLGFWFSPEARVANAHAGLKVNEYAADGANVRPVYLAINNPLEASGGELRSAIERETSSPRSAAAYVERVLKAAASGGHDGIFFSPSGVDRQGPFGAPAYVAFRPEQIKSAIGNRGTFDPTNPDIRYSRGETPDPSTASDELKPHDDAVARAKKFAGVLRAAATKLDNDAQAAASMRAAMPEITPAEIDDLLAQLRRQVTGLRGMARSARDAVTADDRAAGMQDDAMRAADMLSNNLQMAAVIERRNAALNIAARLRASTFLQQFNRPGLDFEGFRALLVGTQRKRAAGRLSVDAEAKAFRGEWLGGMISDMERAGIWREFTSGEFDRDVFIALHAMGRGEQPQVSPVALKIAEVVNKYQEDARNTRNRFGAWIRDLSGYITRQTHDMFKIRDAGFKEWSEYVLPRLDLAKTLRDFDGTIDQFLTRVYDDFASGQHMKTPAGEDDLAAFGRGSNLARRESASRVLYFKDGSAAHEYNVQFGQGRLADTVLQGLESSARSAAMLKVLGTNPEAAVDRLFREYAENLRGDPARRAAFMSKRGELDNLLAEVSGAVNIPGNATVAKWTAFSRAWITMAKLGGMLISSITDVSNYAAEMRFGQDRNLLSGVLDGIGGLTRGRAKGERAEVLRSLGVFHESMIGAAVHRFDSPDLLGGKTAAALQQFFRFTGINWWTETLRDSYALSHSSYLASNAGKAWDKLPDALRDMLGLYNIDAGKWDVLRVAPLKTADGQAFMSAEGLATVPRAVLENYIQQVGRTVSDASVQNLRDDLAGALRAMTIDRMHHAVLEPGARTRAFMRRGTRPGTVPGELLRYIGQFKSFPVAMVQMALGREVYGRGYDTLGEYIRKGKGEMLGLATFIALSVGFGYAAMSIKDLLRGRNPRPADDSRTWMAAFVQGGGLGIYGDFLFGRYNRMGSTLSGSLVGPAAGVLDTVADLWTRIRMGDDVAAASFKALLDNTPFMNIFYTRAALDYLIIHQVQEALNPGFLRRMERRIENDHGQTFWLPPSEVAQ